MSVWHWPFGLADIDRAQGLAQASAGNSQSATSPVWAATAAIMIDSEFEGGTNSLFADIATIGDMVRTKRL